MIKNVPYVLVEEGSQSSLEHQLSRSNLAEGSIPVHVNVVHYLGKTFSPFIGSTVHLYSLIV